MNRQIGVDMEENQMMREQFLRDGYVMCYSGMPMKRRPQPVEPPLKAILDELPALLHPVNNKKEKGH
jgi:hypothetical protein